MLHGTSSQTEYILYAYDYPATDKVNDNRWLRLSSSNDPDEITSKARNLFETQKYKKIEIKKKTYDHRKGCHKAAVFRTYEVNPTKNYWVLAAIFLLSFVSAGIFYLQFG